MYASALLSLYLGECATHNSLYTHLCMCVIFVYTCVDQTRQCMMLSAVEDMKTTIYNSPLSQLRHTVLAHRAGAHLCVCACIIVIVCMQQSGKFESGRL